ncbi:MAG: Mu transposase C-terminal domain-containing protein [Desulfovibrionaceae bacterium]|nr:Mu transposase C-terminal domain-containing protein [Desulfovibrionaceae bacterium]
MAMKDAYTTSELCRILQSVVSSITRRAARENWQSRKRVGRGGGKEWLAASMSEDARLHIRRYEEAQAQAALPALSSAAAPVLVAKPASVLQAILDDRRRYKALARADLVRLYLKWQREHGAAQAQKVMFITAYEGGAWPELKAEVGTVSWKTLERWKLEQERADSVLVLADKRGIAHKGKTALTDRHRMLILSYILNPNAPQVAQVARKIQARCTAEQIFIPSEATIRRWVKAYSAQCFAAYTFWRKGKKAWNDECAISILRDWDLVGVGDVVFADGHTLNFETIDPETGKPKRMTLLLFFDGASGHPLGWEIMASENVSCISAAFRRTCLLLGKFPTVVYIDNGRAFRAKFFEGCANFEEAGFCGLYKSLGCEVIHAWPYHGQTKTVERFFKTMHDLEMFIPSYTGYDIGHKPPRLHRGETLHRKLYEKMGGRPLTLEETHKAVVMWFCEYVQRPQWRTHLKGRTPAEMFEEGRGSGLTPEQTARLDLCMMQKEIRTITKDGISLHGRLFWAAELSNRRHPVLVRYDELLSPDVVKVYTLDGVYVCDALDRLHHKIAAGIHPVARILGTAEQQEDLQRALELKKSLEKRDSATLRALSDTVILPETKARYAAIEHGTATTAAAPRVEKPAIATAADIAAIEKAKEQARAAREAAERPSYTPSMLKRWRDELERYDYLFKTKYEQGIELVLEDEAWMEALEQTPNYQRNMKRRYDQFLELYAFQRRTA